MNQDGLLLTIAFATLLLLILRGLMGIDIRLCLTKKERKDYIKNIGALDRWFFWSAPEILKDKYSRSEKKVIHHKQIAGIYKMVNVAIHLLLAFSLLCTLLYAVTIISIICLNCVYILYFTFGTIALLVIFAIELSTNRRYHCGRYKKRKK